MPKNVLVLVFLLFQVAWSVQITKVKDGATRWSVLFSYVPTIEQIGAFKVHIRFSKDANLSTLSTDAAQRGAWSQIKPELQRKDNTVEVMCVGAAMTKSRIKDTIDIFNISLELSQEALQESIDDAIDSIWFSTAFSTEGEAITPSLDVRTATLPRIRMTREHANSVTYKGIGRVHSLTFNLDKTEMVKATVIDISGKVITKLTEQSMKPGLHTVRWPDRNQRVATGTYFIQLEINNYTYNKKVNYYK